MATLPVMRTLTLTLTDEAIKDLERAAAQEGATAGEFAEELLVAALRGLAIARGRDAWERLKAAGSRIDEETAEQIAGEALAEVRAERHAPGR